MASIKIVLRKKKNREGKYPIAFRITKNRKTSYIYSGEYVSLNEWDESQQKVKKSHRNSTRLNNFLLKKLSEIHDTLLETESKAPTESAKKIKRKVKRQGNSKTFGDIAREYLQNQQEQGKYSSYLSDRSRIKNFTEFLKDGDIVFPDITELLLQQYVSFLHTKKKQSERSITNSLILLRTLFNLAIRDGVVEQKFYPFGRQGIKIKIPSGTKIGLEKDEIELLETISLPENTPIWHTRNVWLISFYFAGMRISDVLRLKWSDMYNNRLYYTMGKNKKAGSLKVPEKATAIFALYQNDLEQEIDETRQNQVDFIFPELKKANINDPEDINRKIGSAVKQFNKYLKRIAEQAGIEKKLTTHIARHSFGNVSGDKIPIQMLQKLYRHTSITTTIGYQANFMYKDADDALDAVIK